MERLPVQTLKSFMKEVFTRIGVPAEEAGICSEILIASDLRGIESHGIGRLKMYYDRIRAGIQNPLTHIEVVRDKAATAVWNGNHGMGHVIGFRAMEKRLRRRGILAWEQWRCVIQPTLASVATTPKWPATQR